VTPFFVCQALTAINNCCRQLRYIHLSTSRVSRWGNSHALHL